MQFSSHEKRRDTRDSFPCGSTILIFSFSGAATLALSHRRPTHAAVLILLPAPAGAWLVAADFLLAVADRLELLVSLGAGDRGLLPLDIARGRCVFLNSRRLNPRAADESLVELLHLEDQIGDIIADRHPHPFKERHAFALVFDLRVDLSVAAQAD